VDLTVCRDVVV